ncbi:MAG: nucleoside triphosphate pyrophosphohydrolase [Candidatus Omnitrophica bacterium]|nr:nucleoside triphosphate pyrophosphohydrolase [Candidatus Omnitrophota bacterium]
MRKIDSSFSRLVRLMDVLRSPKGCPWDRKQNHRSLKICLIEETCEVLEAIDSRNPEKLKEELGDLLYQIIFHTRIAKEKGHFYIGDVIEGIYSKLKKRHPHVFGKEKIRGAEKVIEVWQRRKLERENSGFSEIPKVLPALHKAGKVQRRFSLLGYDLGNLTETLKKIQKEWEELKRGIKEKDKKNQIEKMIGDFLFNIVNLSRLLEIEPETVLHEKINKFVKNLERSRQR